LHHAGVWGGKGQGKTFQTELIFKAIGVKPIIMSVVEMESERAGQETLELFYVCMLYLHCRMFMFSRLLSRCNSLIGLLSYCAYPEKSASMLWLGMTIYKFLSFVKGDLVLCFKESIAQALHFDAHIMDVQRKQHDIRGCRCVFHVEYDHDQSQEMVTLKRLSRRPRYL